jgi:hypothetical protein
MNNKSIPQISPHTKALSRLAATRAGCSSGVIIALLICVFAASGCAVRPGPTRLADLNGINPKISLSQIPAINVSGAKLNIDYKPRVNLGEIRDERPDAVVIVYNETEIESKGDLRIVVQYVLQKALRQRGVALDKDAPLVLEAVMTRWNAEAKDGKIYAEAVVVADLIAPGQVSIFSGVFEGFSEVPSVEYLEKDVQTALGRAMHQALTNLIQDQTLLEYLAAY